MLELITPDVLSALFQVVMIDLALAGDNAIVIILYVALDMIWRGSLDVLPYVASALPG
jgi:predicted tellurium resistance membrane protein TerC